MKDFISILCVLFFTSQCSYAEVMRNKVDSIISLLIDQVEYSVTNIDSYTADIYLKGTSKILKQNYFMKYVKELFPVERKYPKYIFELSCQTSFTYPNHFSHKFQAIHSVNFLNKKKKKEIMRFLSMNYCTTKGFEDIAILPLSSIGYRLYEFKIEEVITSDDGFIYKIKALPKYHNRNLVSSNIYVSDKGWRIIKMDISGYHQFSHYQLTLFFDEKIKGKVLPSTADIEITYSFAGNKVLSTYHAAYKYNLISFELREKQDKKEEVDLTDYYDIINDSVPIINDSVYWSKVRDYSLNQEEELCYKQNYRLLNEEQKDSISYLQSFLDVTGNIVNEWRYNDESTSVKYYGIFNPLQMSFSARNGLTYRQKLRINKVFSNKQEIQVIPDLGFVFKTKELYYHLRFGWTYLPNKLGRLNLSVGNGNRTYSSRITDQVEGIIREEGEDAISSLNPQYYYNDYVLLENNIELFNGLQFSAGLSFHYRRPVRDNDSYQQLNPDIYNLLYTKYNDFVPSIGITFTPNQHYRMSGIKKIYLPSSSPTFHFDYRRSIPNVFNSIGDYEKVELDIHQSIPFNNMYSFNYHLSGGFFSKQKSIYFADFEYFSRRNIPYSWEDERIGGVFNTLNTDWYNASTKYVQAHVMYESPFLVTQLFNIPQNKYLLLERFYVSQLWSPALPCYTEIGYGFGNHLLNVGFFIGFDKGKYQSCNLKLFFQSF